MRGALRVARGGGRPRALIGGGASYVDADLNAALAFKQKVGSYDQGSGDRAAQLAAAFPALKAYLNVGHKSGSLAAGSTAPGWNAGTETVTLSTGSPNLTGYDVQGQVYIPPGVAADNAISDCRIRARANGDTTAYKVQKDSVDTAYRTVIQDSTLEAGQATNLGWIELNRVLSYRSHADNFKGGTTGGASRPMRITYSWGEACGYGNPSAHGDAFQASTVGDTRVVACGFYSAPVTKADAPNKYTGPYSTGSYALTNVLRIDASGAPKLVERLAWLGNMAAFGGLYPIGITAQQTDSIVRNITVALSVFGPAAFRYDGNAGDAVQIHPTFTSLHEGCGLVENVGFYGNEVFGFGPMRYADRGGPSLDVTGIWHWNPATLDASTIALWKDLGLLTSSGVPASGMLRSVAASITTQAKSIGTSGPGALDIDAAGIPSDAVVFVHIAAGHHILEYVA